MEKQPQFLREFSKRNSQDSRRELSGEILEMRNKSRNESKDFDLMIKELEVGLKDKLARLNLQSELINEAADSVEQLSKTPISRMLFLLQIRKFKKEHYRGSQDLSSLEKEIEEAKEKIVALDSEKESKKASIQLEINRLLLDFYNSELEKWRNCGYEKEDIDKYFSEDYLSALSVDEYGKLLSRFPSSTVIHVTRQGVRDHFSHGSHSAGMGELHNGFKEILKTKKLRSKIAAIIEADDRKESLLKVFDLDSLPYYSAQQWCEILLQKHVPENQFLGGRGTYGDAAAIHLGSEVVLDAYYGCEKSNEIFFAFSGLQAVANYNAAYGDALGITSEHEARSVHLSTSMNDSFHNDVWIYANENDGISIETGIVFIPKNAKVDSRNGSIYKIEGNKALNNNGSLIRADETITSEEYWENYFKQTGYKPSKIIYYEENTPTQALFNWRIKNNITLSADRERILKMYEDFYINKEDQSGLEKIGHNDFVIFAEPIFEDYLENRRLKEGIMNLSIKEDEKLSLLLNRMNDFERTGFIEKLNAVPINERDKLNEFIDEEIERKNSGKEIV
ncbi:MAG: hypothetical protein Q8K92_08900 [Leadbetterella sp.]|nr:hypothetical protein [Leadbetterella sp.]